MFLRDWTQDFTAFSEVFWQNEYRLLDRFPDGTVVLDVGAHIGCFALACIQRGAAEVICYEPDPDNYQVLRRNMADYENVRCIRAAVWRSDKKETLEVLKPSNPRWTACSQTWPGQGRTNVAVCSLDDILRGLGHVHLLKLDCEYAEYPILYSATELGRVDRIAGESHSGLDAPPGSPHPYTTGGILDFLASQGFESLGEAQEARPVAKGKNEWFFARRKEN